MDAVAAGLGRQVGPVVHQEGDVARLRHRGQDFGGVADGVVVEVLEAQLHAGDVAGVQRRGQDVGEGVRLQPFGRDQVEPAGVAHRD